MVLALLPAARAVAASSTQAAKEEGATAATSAVVTTMNPERMEALLKEAGIAYETRTDSTGDPAFLLKFDLFKAQLLFYEAAEPKKEFRSIQLMAGFKTPGMACAKINGWNKKFRYVKAYLDDENDARLLSDLSLSGGVRVEAVKQFIERFKRIATVFIVQQLSEK